MREDKEGTNQIRIMALIGVAAFLVKNERGAGIALRQLFLLRVGDLLPHVEFNFVQIKGMSVLEFFLQNVHA